MKNRVLLLLCVPLALGAALWRVNWKLDHPPLSREDQSLRRSLEGGETAEFSQESCQQQACSANVRLKLGTLNREQTRQLRDLLRVAPGTSTPFGSVGGVILDISFRRAGKQVRLVELSQNLQRTEMRLVKNSAAMEVWRIHPRSERRLRAFLDAKVPRRLRP